MPLYKDAEKAIAENLLRLSLGERAPMIAIGCFTTIQFTELNLQRGAVGLHLLDDNEILFIGKHLHDSRSRDGYTREDMIAQIVSAMLPTSVTFTSEIVTFAQNPNPRNDGYGNMVNDRAVFEMTKKKPKAELYSVMPKGDQNKPPK
ncbi:hypothetical protein GR138_11965 [Shinella kummerowiae]|uniref:Uncharacterized protein n=1 Tax=Shinella kummerowiae TaxID=417745 RepID=A0A6N8SGN1_9HYPH|nr:hypothetical protein [Shinella kummerowiae]MXN45910.1 hypothetical protein [Shinella kummerowiae]